MRSPSGSRPHARRVRLYLHSVPFITIAACAVLVIAAGCSKGQNEAAPSESATPYLPTLDITDLRVNFRARPRDSAPAARSSVPWVPVAVMDLPPLHASRHRLPAG